MSKNIHKINGFIYITNNEEIKEGDWVTNSLSIMKANLDGQPTMDDFHPWKKIILTTDQDIIKDGIQKIPTDFLEWYCSKNGKIDFVEVRKECCGQCDERLCEIHDLKREETNDNTFYKPIIPQDQPKQTIEEVELAIKFHDTYEALAPSFGYETREETKQFSTDTPNGKLMIEVCKEIIKWQHTHAQTEIEQLKRDKDELLSFIKKCYNSMNVIGSEEVIKEYKQLITKHK